MDWKLKPGARLLRKELHDQYGGRQQGGVSPSNKSKNVMIFTDPAVGEQHGYFDLWGADGHFHYTGEGQHGDQQVKGGNRSIADHIAEGRAIRLFQGARGEVTYVGEFEIATDLPYYMADAPETNGGKVRSVVVFRLRPLDVDPKPSNVILPPLTAPVLERVPIEANNSDRHVVEPSREPYEAERREAKLVAAYCVYLRANGREPERHKIRPAGEAKPIFTDIYLQAEHTLIEAKGTVERGAIREAIGQLFDYGRFLPEARCGLLLPSEPRADLLHLIHSVGFFATWPEGTTFAERLPQA